MIQGALFLPPSSWAPPTGPLPAIRGQTIAIDTETRDDGLARDMGPGWAYDWGYIAGVSVAWSGGKIYVPIRHPSTECRDRAEVMTWVEQLFRDNEVVFHNMGYDMGWLWHQGCRVWPARSQDTYVAAVLLDENRRTYDLDSVSEWQGVPGKNYALLHEALAAHGIKPADFMSSLWTLPARYVGPYAEDDAAATLETWHKIRPKLEADRVWDAYRTEIDLVPVVHQMRKRGIRVNLDNAEIARDKFRAQRDTMLGEIGRRVGRRVNMSDMLSPDALGTIFDAEGIPYPRTKKTNKPSFTKDWLVAQDHWLPESVRECRKINDLCEKFISTYIMEYEHRGRIHAEIHQLRDTDGGTRTFRFSYANPPLQQMPAREQLLAEAARSIFMPEEGDLWAACDYSQQEYRLAVEFAVRCKIVGAQAAADMYLRDPKTDFHQMIADMAKIPRSAAKIINLAILYGMGLAKLARSLRLSLEEAEDMMRTYHRNNPWIKGLTDECDRLAGERGWIKLIDGARCHFDRWTLAGRHGRDEDEVTFTHEVALERWAGRRIKRAGTRKAMNRLCQGSAARQTKRAMIACHREGILPLIQMHDELGFSANSARDGEMAAEIMRTAVPTKIPFLIDVEYGKTWGHATHKDWAKALAA